MSAWPFRARALAEGQVGEPLLDAGRACECRGVDSPRRVGRPPQGRHRHRHPSAPADLERRSGDPDCLLRARDAHPIGGTGSVVPPTTARAVVAVRITATAPRTVRLMGPPWWRGGEFSSRRGRIEDHPEGARASDLGGAEGTRTPDPLVANEVRYQLRYSPLVEAARLPNARGQSFTARRSMIASSWPSASSASSTRADMLACTGRGSECWSNGCSSTRAPGSWASVQAPGRVRSIAGAGGGPSAC